MCINTVYIKGYKEDEARLISVEPSDRARGNGQKLKHRKLHLNIMKHFFYCEGGQVLAQAAHEDCGVSVLGNIQKPPGHGPGQLNWL